MCIYFWGCLDIVEQDSEYSCQDYLEILGCDFVVDDESNYKIEDMCCDTCGGECATNCLTCDGPGDGDCVTCAEGFDLHDDDTDGAGECIMQEGIHSTTKLFWRQNILVDR